MTTLPQELAELLARDLTRLHQQIEATPSDILWQTRAGVSNSIGNLSLHLEGNLREFVGRQFGALPYTRQRDREFSDQGIPQHELLARLVSLKLSVVPVLAAATDNQLSALCPEQRYGLDMTWREFLIHLLGHLNYHLGQIDYLRRLLTGAGSLGLAEIQR